MIPCHRSFKYIYIDKDERNILLNQSDILQSIYTSDKKGLFVYRKVSDYSKSLDYFRVNADALTTLIGSGSFSSTFKKIKIVIIFPYLTLINYNIYKKIV